MALKLSVVRPQQLSLYDESIEIWKGNYSIIPQLIFLRLKQKLTNEDSWDKN